MSDLPPPLFATPLEYWEDFAKDVFPGMPADQLWPLRQCFVSGMMAFDMHIHRLTRSNPKDGGTILAVFRDKLSAAAKEPAP